MRIDVIDTRPVRQPPVADTYYLTAQTPIGICRECGRDIPSGHESMKCYLCRSNHEEWTDEALY